MSDDKVVRGFVQPGTVKNHKTGKRYHRLFTEPATTDCYPVVVCPAEHYDALSRDDGDKI